MNCEVLDYVGIAADEAHRATGENRLYPLIDWGMSEADCLAYCREKGFNWRLGEVNLYDILDRVSCWCCANHNLKELRNIYKHLPQIWGQLRAMQARTDRLYKGTGIDALEERFKCENLTLF